MLKISSVRHAFPENAGFFIDRKNGHEDFTFLHFYNSVEIIKDGKITKTEPHAVILYDRKTPQYFKSVGPLLHDWFHFSGCIDGLSFNTFTIDEIYYPNNFQLITETVAELETEFFAHKSNSDLLMDLKIKELLIKLDRDIMMRQEDVVDLEYIKKFRLLRGEVFSSLSADWPVANMAKKINLSESHFYVLYKKIYGITPTADLINAKIISAKNMLMFKNMQIDDIAINLGYKNTTHFIRQFKSCVGMTPSEYRKKHKSDRL